MLKYFKNKSLFTTNNAGFSLLEVIIAIALTGLILSPATQAFSIATKAWKSQAEQIELIREAQIAMDRIADEIRRADSITIYYGGGTYQSWLRQLWDYMVSSYGNSKYIHLCLGGRRGSPPPPAQPTRPSGNLLLILRGKTLLDSDINTDEEIRYYHIPQVAGSTLGGIWRYFKFTGTSSSSGEDYIAQNVRQFIVTPRNMTINNQNVLTGARVYIITQSNDGSKTYRIFSTVYSRNILLEKL